MLGHAVKGVLGNAGWLSAGSRLLEGAAAATGSARHASSHSENTNTFLREVKKDYDPYMRRYRHWGGHFVPGAI